MTTRTAGPDYWFVDPAYEGIDRLTDDECPLDEIEKSREWDGLDLWVARRHTAHCSHSLALHLPENCPDGGV